jgi:flagellar biosynthesis/type III secretory pathway M-ring protein FliF/YscJ
VTANTLSTLVGVLLGLFITALGFEMVHSPPDVPWKKWLYRGLFVLLCFGVIANTVIQSLRTERERSDERLQRQREQANERTRRETEQARVEGGLKSISNLVSKLSCPGAAEIGTVFKQEAYF